MESLLILLLGAAFGYSLHEKNNNRRCYKRPDPVGNRPPPREILNYTPTISKED